MPKYCSSAAILAFAVASPANGPTNVGNVNEEQHSVANTSNVASRVQRGINRKEVRCTSRDRRVQTTNRLGVTMSETKNFPVVQRDCRRNMVTRMVRKAIWLGKRFAIKNEHFDNLGSIVKAVWYSPQSCMGKKFLLSSRTAGRYFSRLVPECDVQTVPMAILHTDADVPTESGVPRLYFREEGERVVISIYRRHKALECEDNRYPLEVAFSVLNVQGCVTLLLLMLDLCGVTYKAREILSESALFYNVRHYDHMGLDIEFSFNFEVKTSCFRKLIKALRVCDRVPWRLIEGGTPRDLGRCAQTTLFDADIKIIPECVENLWGNVRESWTSRITEKLSGALQKLGSPFNSIFVQLRNAAQLLDDLWRVPRHVDALSGEARRNIVTRFVNRIVQLGKPLKISEVPGIKTSFDNYGDLLHAAWYEPAKWEETGPISSAALQHIVGEVIGEVIEGGSFLELSGDNPFGNDSMVPCVDYWKNGNKVTLSVKIRRKLYERHLERRPVYKKYTLEAAQGVLHLQSCMTLLLLMLDLCGGTNRAKEILTNCNLFYGFEDVESGFYRLSIKAVFEVEESSFNQFMVAIGEMQKLPWEFNEVSLQPSRSKKTHKTTFFDADITIIPKCVENWWACRKDVDLDYEDLSDASTSDTDTRNTGTRGTDTSDST